jgi:Domain of Unknown Function (DUF1080)
MAVLSFLVGGCASDSKRGSHSVSDSPVSSSPAPKPAQIKFSAVIQTNLWTTNWTELFDGKTLKNWTATDFAGHGSAVVESNQITLNVGADLTGITWTNGTLPKTGYEISLDAIKINGSDFFCGLTFPVADSSCSLIVGGWGGGVVGLSSIDGMDASENETMKNLYLETGKWFPVRVRVTPQKIEVWLSGDKVIDQLLADHKISLRIGDIYRSEPLGIAAFQTTAGIKNLRLRVVHE